MKLDVGTLIVLDKEANDQLGRMHENPEDNTGHVQVDAEELRELVRVYNLYLDGSLTPDAR